MSEVKRFKVADLYHACCGDCIVVSVEQYDASQLKLAALREELAKVTEQSEWRREMAESNCKQHDAQVVVSHGLQQRLAAAEQRNALMVELLTEHQWEWEPYDSHTHRDGGYYCVECQEPKASGHEAGCKLAAALKPTESGASV